MGNVKKKVTVSHVIHYPRRKGIKEQLVIKCSELASSYDRGNEPSDFIKGEKFLDYLSDC